MFLVKLKYIIGAFLFLVIIGFVFLISDHFITARQHKRECTNHQIIIDLKKKLLQKHDNYTANSILDSVLSKYNILKVSYINGKFFSAAEVNNQRALSLLKFLNDYVELDDKKEFSFYVPLEDVVNIAELGFDTSKTPILMVDMDKNTHRDGKYFLVPDFYLLGNKYYKNMQKIRKQGQSVSFQDRKDVVFWRGNQTGGLYNYSTKDNLSRYKAVMFSFHNPSYLDARFVSHKIQVENSESGSKYIEHMDSVFGNNPKQYFIKAQDQVKYKYILSLDGNVSTWERPLNIMVGGSIMFYNSDFMQFFTPYIFDNVHYIAVKSDLSDLKDKVDWLRQNPQKAMEISSRGKEFAETMTPWLFACYYKHVLEHIQNKYVR